MTNRILSTILSLVLLTSCGGGGGGNTSTSGGNSGGGGTTPPNSDSTAEIIFPWPSSGAMSRTVTVNGTASDPEGVARVSVNGVASSVSVSNFTSAIGSTKPIPTAGSTSNAAQNSNTNVTWSARVELGSGDNAITVSVEDDNGGVTEGADTATIKYLEVPITFTLDPDASRLVGQANTRTSTTIVQNLVEHDYSSNEQTVFGQVGATPTLTCFRRFEDEFLFLRQDSGADLNLHRYDLSTQLDVVLSNLPAAFLDGGAGYRPGSVRELACGDTHTSAYVLINFLRENEQSYSKSRIVEIDLAALTFSTLSETDPAAPAPWWALRIALDDDRIVTMQGISPEVPLTSISLADGSRSDLTPGLNIGGMALHPELASDLVYVATFDGVDEINLNAGTRQNISIVSPDHPLAFAQVREIGFDAANNRLIVGDESLDTLIAVDVSTGERSDFVSRRIGSGNPLIVPRKFAISADATRAFVADDGGNVAERLFEVDLATGDRRTIGDINQPYNYLVTGLALDEAGQRVYVSFRHRILEIDLVTEAIDEVAHIDSTVLEYINGLLFDPNNGRLLIIDSSRGGVYSLSPESGIIEVVSRAGEKGSGAEFAALVSLTESGSATEIFVGDQDSGTIFRVNLDTGDRLPLSTPCNFGSSPYSQSLMQIRYNVAANQLLILDNALHSFDLDTNQCDSLPRSSTLLEVQPASAKQLLAVTFGALLQYDRETGEVVVVSK